MRKQYQKAKAKVKVINFTLTKSFFTLHTKMATKHWFKVIYVYIYIGFDSLGAHNQFVKKEKKMKRFWRQN